MHEMEFITRGFHGISILCWDPHIPEFTYRCMGASPLRLMESWPLC